MRRHDQHRQPGLARVQLLHERDAVHRVHAQIDERQVETAGRDGPHGRARVRRGLDIEPHRGKSHLQHLEDGSVVVDDQDPSLHCTGAPARYGRGWMRAIGRGSMRISASRGTPVNAEYSSTQ